VSLPRVSRGAASSAGVKKSLAKVFSPSSFVRSTLPNAKSVFWMTGKPSVKPYSLRWRIGFGAACAKNDFAFQAPFCW
jgi:hypothetical protein